MVYNITAATTGGEKGEEEDDPMEEEQDQAEDDSAQLLAPGQREGEGDLSPFNSVQHLGTGMCGCGCGCGCVGVCAWLLRVFVCRRLRPSSTWSELIVVVALRPGSSLLLPFSPLFLTEIVVRTLSLAKPKR